MKSEIFKSVDCALECNPFRELSLVEMDAVHGGGGHAVTGKEFKGSTNAYSPGAWADTDSSPNRNHPQS
jgi:hypothetical protein